MLEHKTLFINGTFLSTFKRMKAVAVLFNLNTNSGTYTHTLTISGTLLVSLIICSDIIFFKQLLSRKA